MEEIYVYWDKDNILHSINQMSHIMDYIFTNDDLKYNVSIEQVEKNIEYLEERLMALESHKDKTHIRINFEKTIF